MQNANKYHRMLKHRYPKTDALYSDTIAKIIGTKGLELLVEKGKIEHCATFHGRKLYAI